MIPSQRPMMLGCALAFEQVIKVPQDNPLVFSLVFSVDFVTQWLMIWAGKDQKRPCFLKRESCFNMSNVLVE